MSLIPKLTDKTKGFLVQRKKNAINLTQFSGKPQVPIFWENPVPIGKLSSFASPFLGSVSYLKLRSKNKIKYNRFKDRTKDRKGRARRQSESVRKLENKTINRIRCRG